VTTRTHLSIGEVLSLLTDDFPDLTITKIRFLESQGLINPERTASGYRKFYDFDIERLRWILRQQRENFLPLKVIKDRLDRSEGRLPADEDAPVAAPAQASFDLARDTGDADPPPVWMADHARSNPRERTEQVGPNHGGGVATDSEAQVEVATPPGHPEPQVDVETPQEPKVGATAPPKAKAQSKAKAKTKTKAKNTTGAAAKPVPAGVAAGPSPAPVTADPRARPETAMPASQKPAADAAPTAGSDTAPDAAGDVSDVSLTRSELLDAARLEERQLALLESFGIVVPTDDIGDPTYGAEALVCARQAAIFLDLGVEPRHLRAFKVAADREAGLYEQLVLPLLRQRNPTARSEATQIVRRLTTAGAALHAALLQQSLRSPVRLRR